MIFNPANADIGNPKLITGGEASEALPSPQPPVNNFVGADAPRGFSDGLGLSFGLSVALGFPASAGQVC
jgi:hypothetical protein